MNVKGLDVGTANLVASQKDENNKLIARKERDAFFSLDASDMVTEILDNAGANYILDEKENLIYVVGEDALTFANLFSKNARRPMKDGVISNADPKALAMMGALLEGVLGKGDGETLLKYSVPASPANAQFDIVYHESILNKLLEDLGYKPSSINEAMCVVYSELTQERFTGVALSCGAGMVNYAVSNLGIPVATGAIVGSGDQIDEKVAQAKAGFGWTASKVTKKKESGIDIMNPKDDIEETIAIYYKHLIKYIAKSLSAELAKDGSPNFDEPIVIVVAGGTSLIGGFVDALKEEINNVNFPIPVKEIRHAEDPLFAVSYGAHMAAALQAKKEAKNKG